MEVFHVVDPGVILALQAASPAHVARFWFDIYVPSSEATL